MRFFFILNDAQREIKRDKKSRFFKALPKTDSRQSNDAPHEAVVESGVLVVFQLCHSLFELGQIIVDFEVLSEELVDLLLDFLRLFLVTKRDYLNE